MAGKVIQLDIFRNAEMERQNVEQEEFKKNTVKSIRGLFARYNEMEFMFLEVHKNMQRLNEEVFKNG